MFKKIKLLYWRLRIKFRQQCGQSFFKSPICFLSTLSPIMIKEPCFLETIVIFSKWAFVQVECSPDERAALSHQKSDRCLCKVQMLLKTVTICSRNPIFRQIFLCTRKKHFWRLCRNFRAKYGRLSYWKPEFNEKIQNCWNKISKWSSRIIKRSLVNSEQTRLILIKIFSSQSPKNKWKTKLFREVIFLQNDLPYG